MLTLSLHLLLISPGLNHLKMSEKSSSVRKCCVFVVHPSFRLKPDVLTCKEKQAAMNECDFTTFLRGKSPLC